MMRSMYVTTYGSFYCISMTVVAEMTHEFWAMGAVKMLTYGHVSYIFEYLLHEFDALVIQA